MITVQVSGRRQRMSSEFDESHGVSRSVLRLRVRGVGTALRVVVGALVVVPVRALDTLFERVCRLSRLERSLAAPPAATDAVVEAASPARDGCCVSASFSERYGTPVMCAIARRYSSLVTLSSSSCCSSSRDSTCRRSLWPPPSAFSRLFCAAIRRSSVGVLSTPPSGAIAAPNILVFVQLNPAVSTCTVHYTSTVWSTVRVGRNRRVNK